MTGANPRTSAAVNLTLSTRLLADLTKIRLFGAAYVQAQNEGNLEGAAACAQEALSVDKVLSDPSIYVLPIAGQA